MTSEAILRHRPPGGWVRKFDDDREEARSLLKDIRRFPEFAEKFLKIRTKAGRLVPFVLNPVQNWLHWTHVVPKYEAGKPVRVVNLKARQFGVSTYWEGLGFGYTLGHKQRDMLVIAQDKPSATKKIFPMMQRFYNNLPKPGESILPYFPIRRDRVDMLEFNEPKVFRRRSDIKCMECGARLRKDIATGLTRCPACNWEQPDVDVIYLDSRIMVESGHDDKKNEATLGRGGAYQFVHVSEAAYWPNLTASLSALLAACAPEPETIAAIETTANGFNSFHGFWTNLVDPQGNEVDTDWVRVFIPWYWSDEYELDTEGRELEFRDEAGYGPNHTPDYEKWLFNQILEDKTLRKLIRHQPGQADKVTVNKVWRKLLWRRKAIVDICFGDMDTFKQEYPTTDAEAFKFTGVSVFSTSAIARMEKDIREPIWTGNIVYYQSDMEARLAEAEKKGVVPLEEHPHGRFKIWEDPEPGRVCVMAADVAEGRAIEGVGEERSKLDFSATTVARVALKESEPLLTKVAGWHGNCDPDQFGYLLVAIARLFNNAYLGWEINGPGRSLKIQIMEVCKYPKRFIHFREEKDTDRRIPETAWRPGWRTDRGTKSDAVSIGQRYIREGNYVTPDAAEISELKTYSRIGENRYGAAVGHDDRVMATLIMLAIADPRLGKLRERAKKALKELKPTAPFREPKRPTHPVLGTEW